MKFLKSKNLNSAIWVLGGYGGSQLIRLASNLIVTRLLVPEMFGIMALVNAVVLGINMMSDVGVRAATISFDHKQDKAFINTAWTLQVLRGLAVWLVIVAIAYPVESFYDKDGVALYLIICSFSSVIGSFASLNIFLLEKKLEFKKQIIVEMLSQIISIAIMITLAKVYASIWALIAAPIVQSLCFTLLSHTILSGPKMGFSFDPTWAKKIFKFGVWIFLGTLATYVNLQGGDKLILGKSISSYELGIYSMVAVFGLILQGIIGSFSWKMLLPMYRKVVEEEQPLSNILRPRFSILLLAFSGSLFLGVTGEYIIDILYDDRYKGAGWILQIMAMAGMCHSFDDTIRPFLLANQDSYRACLTQVFKSTVFLSISLWSVSTLGIIGILVSMAIAPIVTYFFLAIVISKHGYRWAYIDFSLMLLMVSSFLLVWWWMDGTVWAKISALFV